MGRAWNAIFLGVELNLKKFGKSGMMLSEVGIGTFYDPLWIASAFLGWRRGASAKVDAVRKGLELGVNLIDTAEIYKSEVLVRRGIEGRRRDDLFIATKAWSNHLHADDLKNALERSLRNLGTSYVDLYQVHFPNPRVPIEETMGAMEDLVKEGKVRHIGVSNFNLEQLEQANSALSKYELSSVQLEYSLLHREVEESILPYCEREGIVLLAYYPIGHGKLARDGRLDEVSSKYGKTRAQVAIRWLVQKESVFPIPRASQPAHVAENCGASGWEMDPADVAELNSAFVR